MAVQRLFDVAATKLGARSIASLSLTGTTALLLAFLISPRGPDPCRG